MCQTTGQSVAYTLDAVVLYVSVAVESWDFHKGTSVQNDQQNTHTKSGKHAQLVSKTIYFRLYSLLIYLLLLVLYDNHEGATSFIQETEH